MAGAWRWGALTLGLMGLTGCSLVLDFGGDLIDAAPDDDDGGQPSGDAGNFCDTDEPNNTQAVATPLDPGTFPSAICPKGDRDYYSFSVNGAQDLTIEATFDNQGGLGDLDMLLYSEAGAELMPKGNGFGDVERIERTETSTHGRLEAGNYAVQVFAFDNQRENNYVLTLSIEPPGGALPDAGIADAGTPDAL